MRTHPSEAAVRAWIRLLQAQRVALASVERALKAAGLPPLAWYDVLLELEHAGAQALRPRVLEQQMLLAQYNLSRLIDRMEAAGYVERRACADDGRGQLLAITPAGREVRRHMWAAYRPAIHNAVGARLSENQAALLEKLLGLLIGKSAGG